MGRIIGGVILGYLAMFIVVFVTLTVSFLALGVNRVYLPGAYDVTGLWLGIMTLFSLLAAIAGGWVCAAIGKKKGAVTALIVVVLVLGVLSAISSMGASGVVPVREGDVPNFQAMSNSKEPAWFALMLPVIGVAGVWLGGRSKVNGM